MFSMEKLYGFENYRLLYPIKFRIFKINGKIRMGNKLLKAALYYCEIMNYCIIPIQTEKKKPYIKWEEYQSRKATPEEIKTWWSKWPHAGIGIVTGLISGICVIDIDKPEAEEELQKHIPDSLICPT